VGRPRIYDEARVATAIRLPVALREELRVTATAQEVSVNVLVTRAVSDYLARLRHPVETAHDRPVRRRSSSAAGA
jgi:hypothetical protein